MKRARFPKTSQPSEAGFYLSLATKAATLYLKAYLYMTAGCTELFCHSPTTSTDILGGDKPEGWELRNVICVYEVTGPVHMS
jgi:hypothetical protein